MFVTLCIISVSVSKSTIKNCNTHKTEGIHQPPGADILHKASLQIAARRLVAEPGICCHGDEPPGDL